MTTPTINRINAALAEKGLPLEIVKSDCYFWFAATEGAPLGIEDAVESIYSNHLREMSVEQYVAHVAEGAAKFNDERGGAQGSIDVTPNFATATAICIAVIKDGTAEGKRLAVDELMRYARELDRLEAQARARLDPTNTPTSEN